MNYCGLRCVSTNGVSPGTPAQKAGSAAPANILGAAKVKLGSLCKLNNVKSFIAAHLADAKKLASQIGHGVDPRAIIAVAGNESTWGSAIPSAKYGNYFGLHNRGNAKAEKYAGQTGSYLTSGTTGVEGTYVDKFTTKGNGKQGSVAMAAFPVKDGFLLSGGVLVAVVQTVLNGRGNVTPLEFFTAINENGWATGNKKYPAYMKEQVYDHLDGCV